MAVEVVVLAAGSAQVLMRWEVRWTSLVDAISWQELERRLSRERASGRSGATEIYFRYLGPPFENYDRRLISDLLEESRLHAPGCRTHAVFGPHAFAGPGSPFDWFNLDAVAVWYRSALGAGLNDVLELPVDAEIASAEIGILLRLACDRSEARRIVFEELATQPARWRAVFPERSPETPTLLSSGVLEPFVRYGTGTGEPVVVVLRETASSSPSGQRVLVERALEEHTPARAVVALVGVGVGPSPSRDLLLLCEQLKLKALPFRGLLELRHFLLRLNTTVVASGLGLDRLVALAQGFGTSLPPFRVDPPVETRIQLLPFGQLSPRQFEFLCAAWLSLDPELTDVHLYGVGGERQMGIDLVATHHRRNRKEIWVYQCKRYEDFKPAQLRKAIDEITHPADFRAILLSCEAKTGLRDLAEERDVVLRDGLDISRELKRYPALVEDFFGPGWRNAFNGPEV